VSTRGATESGRYDTPQQIAENMARWREAMEASHAMLMAGLRDRTDLDGDVNAAYRNWNARRREAKLRAYQAAAERYRRWQQSRGTNSGPNDAT